MREMGRGGGGVARRSVPTLCGKFIERGRILALPVVLKVAVPPRRRARFNGTYFMRRAGFGLISMREVTGWRRRSAAPYASRLATGLSLAFE
jgi:hypothetical protein